MILFFILSLYPLIFFIFITAGEKSVERPSMYSRAAIFSPFRFRSPPPRAIVCAPLALRVVLIDIDDRVSNDSATSTPTELIAGIISGDNGSS